MQILWLTLLDLSMPSNFPFLISLFFPLFFLFSEPYPTTISLLDCFSSQAAPSSGKGHEEFPWSHSAALLSSGKALPCLLPWVSGATDAQWTPNKGEGDRAGIAERGWQTGSERAGSCAR